MFNISELALIPAIFIQFQSMQLCAGVNWFGPDDFSYYISFLKQLNNKCNLHVFLLLLVASVLFQQSTRHFYISRHIFTAVLVEIYLPHVRHWQEKDKTNMLTDEEVLCPETILGLLSIFRMTLIYCKSPA